MLPRYLPPPSPTQTNEQKGSLRAFHKCRSIHVDINDFRVQCEQYSATSFEFAVVIAEIIFFFTKERVYYQRHYMCMHYLWYFQYWHVSCHKKTLINTTNRRAPSPSPSPIQIVLPSSVWSVYTYAQTINKKNNKKKETKRCAYQVYFSIRRKYIKSNISVRCYI